MKTKIHAILVFISMLCGTQLFAQTGTYTHTLPNMQSVYSLHQVTFPATPGNASAGTLSCNWLGCQDVGIGNPTFYVYININGSLQTLTSQNAASYCGFVNFNYTIPASILNNAIASGGGQVTLGVYVSDGCVAGMGCSCCNDPYVYNLNLTYNYSVADFTVNDASVCPGETIQFTNTTPGTLTSRKWYFQGGTPATSTANNPNVSYASPGTYDVTLVTTSASGTDSTVKTGFITVNTPPAATISAGGNTTFCNGGSVLLSANTGSGFTYQWRKNSTAITNATSANYSANASGAYSVTVTNANGCSTISSSTNVTVNPKPAAILSAGGNTTVCPGDSVVLSASTGSGYTYQWKKNFTTISGATGAVYSAKATAEYKVIVTNGFGCSKTSNIIPVVVNTPKATITALTPTSVCNGSGVVLKANTGAGLTYQWKIGSTNINGATDSMYTAYTNGSYKVKVTNNCGTATSTVKTVTINPLPTISIIAGGPLTFCTGGSVTLTVSGDTGLTYQWNKNGTAIAGATSPTYIAGATGTYTVTATNGYGCTNTSNSKAVTVNSVSANVTAGGPTTFCNGDSVVLSANTGANLIYQWTRNNITIAGATSSSYIAKTAGTYRVNISNSVTGCAKTSNAVTVTINCKTGLDLSINALAVTASPNPTSQLTTIETLVPSGQNATLEVTTYEGQLVQRIQLNEGMTQLLFGEELTPGVYMITLQTAEEQKVIRLVKN